MQNAYKLEMRIILFFILFLLLSFVEIEAQDVSGQRGSTGKRLEVSIYPNPASESFKLTCPIPISKVEIYNMIGKKVKSLLNKNLNYFDVSDLRNGIYLIRVLDSNYKSIKVLRLGINNQGP